MSAVYDPRRMKAYLDRQGLQVRPDSPESDSGAVSLSAEPLHYVNQARYYREDDLWNACYVGRCDPTHWIRIIRTDDFHMLLLAILVFFRREGAFCDFSAGGTAAQREAALRAGGRVAFSSPEVGKFFALWQREQEGGWSVGYRDETGPVTFFSDLSLETALAWLQSFVKAEPDFDALFAELQRETGVAGTERAALMTVYMSGYYGTLLYGGALPRRSNPPEGAGRFDYPRVDCFLKKHARICFSRGEYGTYLDRTKEDRFGLYHQFDEKCNASLVAEDEDPVRVLIAAGFFCRFDGNRGWLMKADEQQLEAAAKDSRVSFQRKERDKYYLIAEGNTWELGYMNGREDIPLERMEACDQRYADSSMRDTLWRELSLYDRFQPVFRNWCARGLLEKRDWRIMYHAAREGYFA